MKEENKKCCQGCKNGQKDKNKSCEVKLIVEQMLGKLKLQQKKQPKGNK